MLFNLDAAIRSFFPLQRTYNFEVFLPDIDIIPGVVVSPLCQAIRFGDYNIEEVEKIRYGAFQSNYANLLNIDIVVLSFLKAIPDVVSAYFYAWRNLIVNDAGFYKCKSAYARTITVLLYDTTGVMTNMIQLVGAFPTSLPVLDLAYASEDVVKLAVNMSVDRVSYGLYNPQSFPTEVETPITSVSYVDNSDIPVQNRGGGYYDRGPVVFQGSRSAIQPAYRPVQTGEAAGIGSIFGAITNYAIGAIDIISRSYSVSPSAIPAGEYVGSEQRIPLTYNGSQYLGEIQGDVVNYYPGGASEVTPRTWNMFAGEGLEAIRQPTDNPISYVNLEPGLATGRYGTLANSATTYSVGNI